VRPWELKEVRRTQKLLVYFSSLEGKATILVLGRLRFSEFEGGQALLAWGWEVAVLCSHIKGTICLLNLYCISLL